MSMRWSSVQTLGSLVRRIRSGWLFLANADAILARSASADAGRGMSRLSSHPASLLALRGLSSRIHGIGQPIGKRVFA
jgi:hypothetical protein